MRSAAAGDYDKRGRQENPHANWFPAHIAGTL
jgi:hypothetical protein